MNTTNEVNGSNSNSRHQVHQLIIRCHQYTRVGLDLPQVKHMVIRRSPNHMDILILTTDHLFLRTLEMPVVLTVTGGSRGDPTHTTIIDLITFLLGHLSVKVLIPI